VYHNKINMPTQSNTWILCIYTAKNNYLHSFNLDLFPSLFRRLLDLQICFSQSSIDMFPSPRLLTSTPRKTYMDTQNGNIWKGIHLNSHIVFGIYVRFRGEGVGLLASFGLNNTEHHPAAQCDSCTRQQQHGKAQKRHGFVGYLSHVSGREDPPETGRSHFTPT